MERRRIDVKDNRIEDSIAIRLAIFYLVFISILSVWYFLNLSAVYIGGVLLFTAFGYIFSYLRRRKNNVVLKIFMTIGMLYLLRQFFVELIKNPFDPRVPLAVFLINLNTLHSLDLPTRLDLSFSFFISLILMVISGIFARESFFLVFIIFYFLGFVITLFLLNNYKPSFSRVAISFFTVLLIGFLLFPILPKNIRIGFRQDIMSQLITRITNIQGELSSPYSVQNTNLYKLPEGRKIPPLPFNKEEYYGFAPFVDLRQRGMLSSALVFRVLTSWEVYHRGIAFDTYNGFGWYQSKEEIKDVATMSQPFLLKNNPPTENILNRATYFIEKDIPSNIIFLPYNTQRLYFPSPLIFRDGEEGYRAPFDLPKGLIYTSFYMDIYPSAKDLLNAEIPDKYKFRRYLELPNLPKRIYDLTFEITKSYEKPWDKLMAIKKYLEKYEYSLDIPPLPDNIDAVDDFLFVTKKGYCEQFASAFAVMARIIGIPSRFITGYSPGDLNPWTGMYEVKVKNAHAWVEVYLEPVGWIPIDPTPFTPLVEERDKSLSVNLLSVLFASIGEIIESLFVLLYKITLEYRYVVFVLTILFVIWFFQYLINKIRLNQEDRIFRRVIKKLKRKGLIKDNISLYEMMNPLGEDGLKFAGLYYALKFAPLSEEEKRKYLNEMKDYAKKILSNLSSRSQKKI
jgi:hypothetical protein